MPDQHSFDERLRLMEIAQAQNAVLVTSLQKSIDNLAESVDKLNTYASKTKGAYAIMIGIGAAMAAIFEVIKSAFGSHTP